MRYKIPAAYRQPIWGGIDPRLKRAMTVSSSLAAIVLAVVWFAPVQTDEVRTVEDVSERLAKLILADRKPAPPTAPARVKTPQVVEQVPEVSKPAPPAVQDKRAELKQEEATTKDVGRRRQKVAPTEAKGQAGRNRAEKEVTRSVAAATKSVESTLQNLTADLTGIGSSARVDKPSRRRGKARVRRGRGSKDLGGAVAARTDLGLDTEVEGALLTTSEIDIEALTEIRMDLASSDPGFVAGEPDNFVSGVYRSNASLIAVVRKYAAGIQFCYDNELKRSPGLDGKMVVVLTVLPSGQVAEATIQKDTLGSARLQDCVLTQIRAWKFPTIPEGTVTFRSPFVFTPPNN